ncbi:thiamine diphosphokinase [Sporosarcina sp. HYO08]|uniref:thiamine diphosphokinase n=1 Tax=Sporosarcina sp. HYO08 TaxID=1759557 RepID=UPI000798BADC|nr:thiamine diphosphokinase [Sporosarcina sp. HYO08]KXH79941.1 thiamine pyrophosphokinase [Sporosarcina sp. HYO08]
MKSVIICGGGPESEIIDFSTWEEKETVFIGADRGTLYLLQRGITPTEAVGDFDSISAEDYEMIAKNVQKVDRYRAEKDETDIELAVGRALAYEPEQVVLTGVTGGRLDHFQSALHLLYRYQIANPAVQFLIGNQTNTISLLTPGVRRISPVARFPYISFYPFGASVKGFTLTGFKYETVDATLETGVTMFTSNEPVAEVCTISFRDGICLMVRSTDS